MQSAGSVKVVWLLAPAGLSQSRVIQLGPEAGVIPIGPQAAAVVKTVWLFAGGFVQVVS